MSHSYTFPSAHSGSTSLVPSSSFPSYLTLSPSDVSQLPAAPPTLSQATSSAAEKQPHSPKTSLPRIPVSTNFHPLPVPHSRLGDRKGSVPTQKKFRARTKLLRHRLITTAPTDTSQQLQPAGPPASPKSTKDLTPYSDEHSTTDNPPPKRREQREREQRDTPRLMTGWLHHLMHHAQPVAQASGESAGVGGGTLPEKKCTEREESVSCRTASTSRMLGPPTVKSWWFGDQTAVKVASEESGNGAESPSMHHMGQPRSSLSGISAVNSKITSRNRPSVSRLDNRFSRREGLDRSVSRSHFWGIANRGILESQVWHLEILINSMELLTTFIDANASLQINLSQEIKNKLNLVIRGQKESVSFFKYSYTALGKMWNSLSGSPSNKRENSQGYSLWARGCALSELVPYAIYRMEQDTFNIEDLPSVFVEAQEEIYHHLKNDAFPRYRRSEHFKELTEDALVDRARRSSWARTVKASVNSFQHTGPPALHARSVQQTHPAGPAGPPQDNTAAAGEGSGWMNTARDLWRTVNRRGGERNNPAETETPQSNQA